MLSLAAIAADCDAHILLADTGRTAAQTAYLLNCINRAVEEMRVLCPQVFRKTYDVTWAAGVGQSVALTSGSKTWAGTGAAGSSVLIGEDLGFNEIASSSTLLFPFSGATGTHPVTVYGDSVVLNGTAGRVIGCALLSERRELAVLNSRAEWMEAQGADGWWDYGVVATDHPARRTAEAPRFVWLETALTAAGAIEFRARCAPLPNGTYRATLEVETMDGDVTENDISDPAATRAVPGSRAHGILRALCLYHWTGSPWFRNDAARSVIQQGYVDAVAQLNGFRPHAATVVRSRILY